MLYYNTWEPTFKIYISSKFLNNLKCKFNFIMAKLLALLGTRYVKYWSYCVHARARRLGVWLMGCQGLSWEDFVFLSVRGTWISPTGFLSPIIVNHADTHRGVIWTRGNGVSRRVELDGVDVRFVTFERLYTLTSSHVPDECHLVASLRTRTPYSTPTHLRRQVPFAGHFGKQWNLNMKTVRVLNYSRMV